ncbi:T9SS type A sorting domain-containing protein [Hymenobacter sp. NST-14]|uniref:T9SS type A sorting domain-containing protein n=1 Tax=Hymenobacter piscis TaxID=2839984 RepID=UPI001C02417F|nr:T9SS type A sorting domain-containing protein [Hymenobacter piscis]MBT9393285.1 T9SS type A sorting domain-containing protein [Hymenobacter piscis]
MKKILLPVLTAVALLTGSLSALAQNAPVVEVTTNITTNTTWSNRNIYLLKSNFIYVTPGTTLTIEPGTIIKGDKASKATLVVQRGGKLMADGTAQQPIVFTSNETPGNRRRGDWGGIVIAGAAPVNQTNPSVEATPDSNFGGTDANDNSGVLRYVRIEFPGIAFAPDTEINGLTLGGVGKGTVIDYVQISYSGDDAFEWFGGTVDAKHLVAFRTLDDNWDCDNGFSGRVQFAYSLRDPNIGDVSGSNGFETDNDRNGSAILPQTAPVFSNVTDMVERTADLNSNVRSAMHLRRNSATSIFNSVFTGYRTGLLLDGTASQANATGGSLQLRNVVLAGIPTNFAQQSGGTFGVQGFFEEASRANTVYAAESSLLLEPGTYTLTNPLKLPTTGSPLLTGASFTDPKVADPFFEQVTYRGAFGTTDWTQGWTNFDPQTTPYTAGITLSRKSASDQLQQLAVAPNPTAGAAQLSFNLKRSTTASVRILDLTGRQVATLLTDGKLTAGTQSVALPANLQAGVYLAVVTTNETSQSVRFVVAR